jgi:hypothetical protein
MTGIKHHRSSSSTPSSSSSIQSLRRQRRRRNHVRQQKQFPVPTAAAGAAGLMLLLLLFTASTLLAIITTVNVNVVNVDAFTTTPPSPPSLSSDRRGRSFHVGWSTTTTATTTTTSPSSLHMALIYGWDDYDDPADDNKKKKTTTTSTPYVTTDNYDYSPFSPTVECPTVGASVAETLTGNQMKTGSLARLAVRFARESNPEHSGLDLEEIENVRVLCVHSNSLELEATLCETHGCVSLHVPIKFPSACSTTGGSGSGDGAEAHFEACVLQHLEALDVDDAVGNIAATTTEIASHAATDTMIQQWMDSTQLTEEEIPTWWVNPNTFGTDFTKECSTLMDILNEDEFNDELNALAKDALAGTTLESGIPYDTLVVEKSKCLRLGPSGIALKILAKRTDIVDATNKMILDVFYPFESGTTTTQMTTPDLLRAAVLGAIAKASPSN